MPDDLLRQLWERADAGAARFTADEVAFWPSGWLDQLSAAGLLRPEAPARSVVCDACSEGHAEEIQWIESPPGTGRRAYIMCPTAGRVRVEPGQLRQWGVDLARVAELTAAALGAAGGVEELVSGRVWLLGKLFAGDRSREVFLACGLHRRDGGDVVGRCARLSAAAAPVVLVPAFVPPREVWPEAPPVVVPLSALLTLDGTQVVIDRPHLDGALGAAPGKPRSPSPVRSFPTPAGATWEDVVLTLAEHGLHIAVRGVQRVFTFQEAGFEDRRRRNVPNQLWALLQIFARRGGLLSVGAAGVPKHLKQIVGKLDTLLVQLIQLDGKAFRFSRNEQHYRANFHIGTEAGVVFPVPPGATWDSVAVIEVEPGVVSVAVEATEDFAVFTRDEEERHDRWEGAQRAGSTERRYDLTTLGLANSEGRPSPVGTALLELLRAGGRLRRPDNDEPMLRLSEHLSRLLPIDGPPFQFLASGSVWIANFEAVSRVAGRPPR